MIDLLEVPQTREGIKDEFSNISEKEFNDGFAGLDRKGLLFAENGKYISLVCSKVSWQHEGYLAMNRFISLTTGEAF